MHLLKIGSNQSGSPPQPSTNVGLSRGSSRFVVLNIDRDGIEDGVSGEDHKESVNVLANKTCLTLENLDSKGLCWLGVANGPDNPLGTPNPTRAWHLSDTAQVSGSGRARAE